MMENYKKDNKNLIFPLPLWTATNLKDLLKRTEKILFLMTYFRLLR